MQCGNERMCGPCWDSTPDQAAVLCRTVDELRGDIIGGTLPLLSIETVLANNCARNDVDPEQLVSTLRRMFEEDGVQVSPINLEATEPEVE